MTDTLCEVTPDGSPVAVYLAIPAEPAFTPLLEHLAPGARVLDLGCGVGRLANLLVRRGHEVVGVDESAEMLDHLDTRVTGVQATIETLDLLERFDAVVLASHLVNDLAPGRTAFLEAAARHLTDDGVAYVEHWAPHVIGHLRDGDGSEGPVAVSFRLLEERGRVFDAAVTYELGEQSWTQRFTAELLDEDQLDEALAAAKLRRRERLTPKWLVASR